MESDLRCNVVQCRKILNTEGRACVTTCSRKKSDDIVFADLNPSEDYKSSVLSGLRPDIIMEICSRALSFWTYQTTQEACFQELMYKSLEDKYTQLEKQVQGLMRDAQSEVTTLQKDMELEKRKTHDLAEQLQEKGRQFSKLQ
ncbi:10888_t:CDS:2, partial [Racocetra persica]